MGLAFLITSENLQLLSERKVLKEAEYSALLDASAVVQTAREEAARIAQQASRQAEEGRRKGYDEGLRQAKSEYAKKLANDAAAAERQLLALRTAMARLVVKVVSQFMSEADPSALFKQALLRVESLIRDQAFITLKVPPTQEAVVRQVLAELRAGSNWSMNASVVADASLPEGACTVQTLSGTLDIGLDAQLEALRKAVEHQGHGLDTPGGAR